MIPKCGRHLLAKCLALMDHAQISANYLGTLTAERDYAQHKRLNTLPPPNHYRGKGHPLVEGPLPARLVESFKKSHKHHYWNHFAYSPEYNRFLDSMNVTKFLMIRDPRAMLLSFAHMVKEGFEPGQEVEFEALVLDLIDGRKKSYIPWGVSRHTAYPTVWEIGICDFYKSYLSFMESKNCLTVRFENLVGSKGGGSDELQRAEIKKIAEHVGVTLDDVKIASIANDLFGGSSTFREGKIDGWKKYFTPAMKAAFKAVPGADALLVALGYETDVNW